MSFLEDFDPDAEREAVIEAHLDREQDRYWNARLEAGRCKQCGKQYESIKWLDKHLKSAHQDKVNSDG